MSKDTPVREGRVVVGALFSEPMRVEKVQPNGPDTWVLGLVDTQTERFRKVTLTSRDLDGLRFPWREVTKVANYRLEVDAMTSPMMVREDPPPYGMRDQ